MKNEARKRAVLRYGECGLEFYAQDVPNTKSTKRLGRQIQLIQLSSY